MAGSEPAKKVRLNKAKATEERRLIEAAQRDPVCFAELYESYFELVYAYVARRVRNRTEAEDLTAEVFRKALANLPRFKMDRRAIRSLAVPDCVEHDRGSDEACGERRKGGVRRIGALPRSWTSDTRRTNPADGS